MPPASISDPLQSLKDVKVPGFSLPSAVSQSIGASDRPPSGPAVENIKKEPDYGSGGSSARGATNSPAHPPMEKSPALKSGSGTTTPSISVSQTPPLRQTSEYW